jgi:hypothetical protein
MRGVTTVTSLLDTVTALAEGSTNLLRDAEVFPLNSHSVKPDGMTSSSKLIQLLRMALTAFFRKDHGLLIGSGLVVDVTGHTMDPVLCVLRFDPRLEKSGRYLLMALDTESWINSRDNSLFRRACAHGG